ncbi:PQQ-binding-like beta-propeller repeat protein [Roseiconus nitratireducens]|uniref:PQQ-binding-like beta-propeller repeat protein n=1 Tax=Roseiconus nitratireducens TaxID=2605748 RepID=A0A5M6DH08_9BACT|nr:PQQ-binding-like beta-propeller repeat protein [Roseiconus nitratireducens]KAA5545489.1 PQQ-binding-like beta-propeller repeat protein [Roseiconus nitratireducens]
MRSILVAACAFIVIQSATPAGAEDWPRWGGPNRNAISDETGLLQQWPEGGPSLAWRVNEIGAGMGGIAVSEGRIYTTGDVDGSAWLFALNEESGEQIWKAKIGAGGSPGFIFQPAGPRATPAVHGDRIYILGQYGDFCCFTTSGEEVWRTNYVDDLGGIMPKWGYSESPLVDGDQILCVPGGPEDTIVALNKDTAKPIWKCHVPAAEFNPRYGNDSAAGYSSAIVVEFEGIRQYVQFTSTTLVGVAAKDGKLLWRYDKPANTHRIPCSTPIYHDGVVFAASAYDAGGGAVRLSADASGGVTAEEIYFNPIMKNHHGGMILTDGYLYGAAGGNFGGFLVCLDFASGERQWAERDAPKGSLMMADGRLYLRVEDGTMILIEPNGDRYLERGRFEQPDRSQKPAWTHPVIANGKLYIRDQETLFCYDVKKD